MDSPHHNPCLGQGGSQCWGPPDQNCPDCGRSWGPSPEPFRRAYSLEAISKCLSNWMVAEYGHPRTLTGAARDAWHQRDGLIMHFLRCHFPDASGKFFQDYLDPNPES